MKSEEKLVEDEESRILKKIRESPLTKLQLQQESPDEKLD